MCAYAYVGAHVRKAFHSAGARMREIHQEQSILRQRSATRILLFILLDPHLPVPNAAADTRPPCYTSTSFSLPTNVPVIMHCAKTQLHLNVDDILLRNGITAVHKM